MVYQLSGIASGYCTIDLIKHGRPGSALATGREIQFAAFTLISQCVGGRNGQGGTAINIGRHASTQFCE